MSVAKVILVGNIGKAPEVRDVGENRVMSFSVATNRIVKKEKQTQWNSVTVWNERTIDYVQQYGGKGSRVYVEGNLEVTPYTDKEGRERTRVEVVVGRFNGDVQLMGSADGGGGEARATKPKADTAPDADIDDDIPF